MRDLHALRFGGVCLLVTWMALCARAELLVYEPFAYPDGWLNGQGGALGTSGTWSSTDGGWAAGWRVHPEGELTGIAVNPGFDPADTNAPGILNEFTGIVSNLPTAGAFVGASGPQDRGGAFGTDAGTGNMDAHIGLRPKVTASFKPGSTTWFSYVGVHAWDRNQGTPTLTIGTDPTTVGLRGLNLQNAGNGVCAAGGPPRANLFDVYPHYFSGGIHHQTPGGYFNGVLGDHNGIVTAFASTGTSDGVLSTNDVMAWQVSNTNGFGAANIVVGKIEWDAGTNGTDIITVVRFLETETLSEAAFNARVAAQPSLSSKNWRDAVTPANTNNPANLPDLDQSQFDTLNISSLKFFVDEIRIATTFAEIAGEILPSPGTLLQIL